MLDHNKQLKIRQGEASLVLSFLLNLFFFSLSISGCTWTAAAVIFSPANDEFLDLSIEKIVNGLNGRKIFLDLWFHIFSSISYSVLEFVFIFEMISIN